MYEMLVGYPPFYSDEPMTTCRKVGISCRLFVSFCVLSFVYSEHCPCCFKFSNNQFHKQNNYHNMF